MTEKEFKTFVQEMVKEVVREMVREEIRIQKLVEDRRLAHEWYSLNKCATLKGVSNSYLRQHPEKQPAGGNRKVICGIKRFHRSDVILWLMMDDSACEQEFGRPEKRTA